MFFYFQKQYHPKNRERGGETKSGALQNDGFFLLFYFLAEKAFVQRSSREGSKPKTRKNEGFFRSNKKDMHFLGKQKNFAKKNEILIAAVEAAAS